MEVFRTAEDAINQRDGCLQAMVTMEGYDARLQLWHFAKEWNAIAKKRAAAGAMAGHRQVGALGEIKSARGD
jgi:hypothetical protein